MLLDFLTWFCAVFKDSNSSQKTDTLDSSGYSSFGKFQLLSIQLLNCIASPSFHVATMLGKLSFISKYPNNALFQLEPWGQTLKRFVDVWFSVMGQTGEGGFAFFWSTWLLSSFIIYGSQAFWPLFLILPKKALALEPVVTLVGDGHQPD